MSSTIGKGKPPWLGSWATKKLRSSHPVIAIDKSTNHVVWEDFWIGGTFLFLSSIPSGEEFGTPSMQIRVVSLSIASEENVSSPTLRITVFPNGTEGADAYGNPAIRLLVSSLGQIQSQEQVSNLSANLAISPTGVSALDEFGTPVVQFVLHPNGITSQEAFGLIQVLGDIIREPRIRIALQDALLGSVIVSDARKSATQAEITIIGSVQASDREVSGTSVNSTQLGEVTVSDNS